MRAGRNWEGPITSSRKERGSFYTTVPKLLPDDNDSTLPNNRVGTFRNYFRLSIAEFELVLDRVGPLIQKVSTNLREPISPKERLMVTLRYLATGSSLTQLHYDWCISVAALSNIIPKTCSAIYETMKDEYLSTPTTEEQWVTISQQLEANWNFPNALGKYTITIIISI